MKNGSIVTKTGCRKPVYGIYFWWFGIAALNRGLLLLLKHLYTVFCSGGNWTKNLDIVLYLRIALPYAAILAVVLVFLVYRIGKFRGNPPGGNAAAVWCLCLAIPPAYQDFVPEMVSHFIPSGAAVPWFLPEQSYLYRMCTPSYSVIALLVLSVALLSAGEILEMQRFRIAGFLLAAAGIVYAYISPKYLLYGSTSTDQIAFLDLAAGVAEPICLLWTGLALKFRRPRGGVDPGTAETHTPGGFPDRILNKFRRTEIRGSSLDCWKNPASRSGVTVPEDK